MSGRAFPGDFFAGAGLNRQHVFALADLPVGILSSLQPRPEERQLILLGHAGRRLWDCVQAAGLPGEHPIDDYCRQTIAGFFAEHLPGQPYRLAYPGDTPVGLQALGTLAGWHHPSPFMIGVDRQWGSWFAYRAVILCATDFAPTPVGEQRSPCLDCRDQPCIAACPAGATGTPFRLAACGEERLRPGSACAYGCLARNACPVGGEHRYEEAQIRHSFAQSLVMLRRFAGEKGG
jgi:epoxyqueuosine reductase